ncbi:MAG: hypothetical protein NC453_24975 [Muribaculum sp.]|nr:hypothetical protein [Muribaculum sp.]
MNKLENKYSESMLKLEEADNLQKRMLDTYQRLEQFKYTGTILSWQQILQKFEILQNIEDLRQERDKKLNEALSKALDIFCDEIDLNLDNYSATNNVFASITSFIVSNNIQFCYSVEVRFKILKVMEKLRLKNNIDRAKSILDAISSKQQI